MSVSEPGADCRDVAFQAACPLGESAQLALEDYARVLTRARAAEVLHGDVDPSKVTGVHLCRPDGAVTPAAVADIEGFAWEMATRAGGGAGLGWS